MSIHIREQPSSREFLLCNHKFERDPCDRATPYFSHDVNPLCFYKAFAPSFFSLSPHALSLSRRAKSNGSCRVEITGRKRLLVLWYDSCTCKSSTQAGGGLVTATIRCLRNRKAVACTRIREQPSLRRLLLCQSQVMCARNLLRESLLCNHNFCT